ncbi:hypothetical protein ACIGBH_39585 [Streptomyces sp. NPDC085929]|uniref:hypothetical protein n=1 Tax=Streptomyces sp. NPDC085929 TaxID=3365739 RepID=UPI0037D28568
MTALEYRDDLSIDVKPDLDRISQRASKVANPSEKAGLYETPARQVIADLDVTGSSTADLDVTGSSTADLDVTGSSTADLDVTGS